MHEQLINTANLKKTFAVKGLVALGRPRTCNFLTTEKQPAKSVRPCIMGQLANEFCRSCRDVEENETILHLLGTSTMPKAAYYMNDLLDLQSKLLH